MKRSSAIVLVASSTLWLAGCSVSTHTPYYTTPTYNPAYNTDYVYSVGYYGYRPVGFGTTYNTGYTWGNPYWYGNRPYRTYHFGRIW